MSLYNVGKGYVAIFDLLLFRYYAWDYRVLKTFAKHYSTGEVIPKKLVDSMQAAKMMFAATELQRQVCWKNVCVWDYSCYVLFNFIETFFSLFLLRSFML